MIPAVPGSSPGNGEAGTCYQQARPQIKNNANELSYPYPASVKGRVLGELLASHKLTHMDVWQRHGSSRAAHHILMLRKAGWPILTEEINAPTSDGRMARIAIYSLPSEAIEAAGDRGQRYAAECVKVEAKRGIDARRADSLRRQSMGDIARVGG